MYALGWEATLSFEVAAGTVPGAFAASQVVKAPGNLVISAYVTCPDITLTVTPDLKLPGRGRLLWVDLGQGRCRLGGSALAHAYSQVSSAHGEGFATCHEPHCCHVQLCTSACLLYRAACGSSEPLDKWRHCCAESDPRISMWVALCTGCVDASLGSSCQHQLCATFLPMPVQARNDIC